MSTATAHATYTTYFSGVQEHRQLAALAEAASAQKSVNKAIILNMVVFFEGQRIAPVAFSARKQSAGPTLTHQNLPPWIVRTSPKPVISSSEIGNAFVDSCVSTTWAPQPFHSTLVEKTRTDINSKREKTREKTPVIDGKRRRGISTVRRNLNPPLFPHANHFFVHALWMPSQKYCPRYIAPSCNCNKVGDVLLYCTVLKKTSQVWKSNGTLLRVHVLLCATIR